MPQASQAKLITPQQHYMDSSKVSMVRQSPRASGLTIAGEILGELSGGRARGRGLGRRPRDAPAGQLHAARRHLRDLRLRLVLPRHLLLEFQIDSDRSFSI